MYRNKSAGRIELIHKEYYCVDDDNKDIDTIEAILRQEYEKAEREIDIKLYKIGYIYCNGDLEKVEEAKTWDNPLIQAHIARLESETQGGTI